MDSRNHPMWRTSLAALAVALCPFVSAGHDDGVAREPTQLRFEPNRGQTDGQVKFLSRGRGYGLFLTATEAVLVFGTDATQDASRASERVTPSVLRMQLVDADPAAKVVGTDELAGRVHHFVGNDPKRWRRDIPTYRQVRYHGVYPGVDLTFYGNPGLLEHDFIVSPGVDPDAIRLRFQGAKRLTLDARGDLVLRTSNGDVRLHRPVAYQGREGARETLRVRYALKGEREVGFKLAAYDRERPLVIDPVLSYSTYLGGSSTEQGSGLRDRGNQIAVDSAGNVYVTGQTFSTNFPVANALQPTAPPNANAFVAKLDPSGTALVYSTYLGGAGNDAGGSVVVDAQGNAYVTGRTSSADFPVVNAVQDTFGGLSLFDGDAFVAKLDAAGSSLLYSTYLGGVGDEMGLGLAVDATGSAYVVGTTTSADFPLQNALQSDIKGDDVFKTANGAVSWAGSGLGNRGIRAFAAPPGATAMLYAGTEIGVFRSADGGATWSALNAGLTTAASRSIRALAIDSLNPTTLYAATGEGVFKSVDGAANWSAASNGLPSGTINLVAADPAMPSTLYAAPAGGGIFKSVDGGQNWSSAGLAGLSLRALAIDPILSSTLYAGTNFGVYKSLDGGTNWVQSDTGISNRSITALAIDPRTPFVVYAGTERFFNNDTNVFVGGIFKSLNGGLSWTETSNGLSPFGILELAIDPVVPQILYASQLFTGVVKSVNGGLNWVSMNSGLTKRVFIGTLLVDPVVSATVYAGSTEESSEAFVTKLDPGGSSLVYSTYLGGNNFEWGRGVAVDAAGHAHVTGGTMSRDFPLANPFQSTYGGDGANGGDAFVAKLDPAGTALIYSTYLGGSAWDEGEGIALDANGNAHVVGPVDSADFPTLNALQPAMAGLRDGFVARLDAAGTLRDSTYLGGSGNDQALAVAVDGFGNVHVSGLTESVDFPTVNAVQPARGGFADAFVAALNPALSALVHSTYLGGASSDYGTGVAADPSGATYVGGWTCSTDFPVVNALQPTLRSCFDLFVTKIAEP